MMMAARVLLSSRLAGLAPEVKVNLARRAYSAVAAAAREEPAAMAGAGRLPAAAADKAAPKPTNDCPWTRDPKTGYWMPENHLNDVDAAELRARLLFSKKD
ncbi:hypothetical protein ACP70R_000976 [Stipagrostis hirtigluma subsp. patula]